MATPSGNRNGSNSHNHSANVVKTIIFIGLVALFQIRIFGASYSDGYTKGLRSGEVHAIHGVEEVSQNADNGEISISEIVEIYTDVQTFKGDGISPSSSTSTEKSSESMFNDTETQRGPNEQTRNSTEEEVTYSSLSIETEIIPVSLSNGTGTQLEKDKQQDDKSKGTTTASSSNETTTGLSKLTSSSSDRNVTSGTFSYNSSVTVPILSTNNSSEVKTNTGFEEPRPGSVIARNETESSATFELNSTDSATKIVGLGADDTNNSDPTSVQKNWTGSATKIVWPDTTNTNTSKGIRTSVKATGNDTSLTLTVSNRTESEDELSPEDKQNALWSSTRETFYATKPWLNTSTFTTVDRDVYQQLVKKAQSSVKSIVEEVYTDCEMYILPTSEIQNETPMIQYKCLGDDNPILQDDLCHTVNMCRVIMDEEAWNAAGAVLASGASITNSTIDSTNSSDKSTLLMIVDSVEYMMKPQTFSGVINKASYAYRSNRPLYIWIGNLDEDELNRREIESFAPTFGFRCTEKELKNSMHYYKPIAFLTLFDTLASSSLSSRSIFYLDADAAFTATAFERIENDKFYGKSSNRENLLGPIGPESFLGLSPQASLMATQNIKGKMMMNSGVMLLRDTRWSRDFLALWWYGRCGYKDQLALWLVLYATFSAWTTAGGESSVGIEGGTQFAYPGDIFFDYAAANQKLFMHFRSNVHSLQAAWEVVVEQRRKEQNLTGIERNDEDDYDYPVPTNTKLYNGGSENLGPRLFGPVELPHVVILSPVKPVSYNKTIQHTSEDGTPGLTVQVHLPRLKSEDDDSLVVHSKTIDGCSKFRCWPYK